MAPTSWHSSPFQYLPFVTRQEVIMSTPIAVSRTLTFMLALPFPPCGGGPRLLRLLIRGRGLESENSDSQPTRGTVPARCASAASGAARRPPATVPMNLRRSTIRSPGPRAAGATAGS